MSRKPSTKASRLTWVQSIPDRWDEKRAKFVFRDIDERSDSGSEELLSVSHITGVTPRSEKNVTMFMAETYEGQKLCQPDDVVINSLWAWMGAVGVSKHRGIVSSAYGVYRPRNSTTIYPPYANYLLRTKAYAGEYLCRSTGIWTSRLLLTPSEFLTIPILLPPLPDQRRIAVYLDEATGMIDRLMSLRRRQMELLREQRAALIQQAVTRGLNPRAPLKDSGLPWLGQIPAHWEVFQLKRLLSRIEYGISERVDIEGTFVCLRMGDVNEGEISFDNAAYVNAVEEELLLNEGDLLFNRTNSLEQVGKVAIFRGHPNKQVTFASYLVRLRATTESDAEFLNYLLNSTPILAWARSEAIPAIGQANLNPTRYCNLRIAKPPVQEQREIVAYIQRETAKLDGLRRSYERQLALLAEYRASLIHECVTGQRGV